MRKNAGISLFVTIALVPALFLSPLFAEQVKEVPEIPIFFWLPPFDQNLETRRLGNMNTECDIEKEEVMSALSQKCLKDLRQDTVKNGGNALIVLEIKPWPGNPAKLWVKSLVVQMRLKSVAP